MRPALATRAGLAAALLVVGAAALACEERGEVSVTSAAELSASGDAVLRGDCYGCHVADFARAHGPGERHQVPTTCDVCHRETAYHPIERVHPWPLTGKHDEAGCFDCHDQEPPVFAGMGSECVACHRSDYDRADYPGHDRFALTCGDCHGTDTWRDAKKPVASAVSRDPELPAQPTAPTAPLSHPAKPSPAKPSPAKPKAQKPKAQKPAAVGAAAPVGEPPAAAPVAEATPTPAPSAAPKPEHPEARFPLTRGNHVDIACADCHTGPGRDGKANTSCVGCHKRTRYDGKHSDVARYPLGDAPAYFCVECHTDGTRRARR